MQTDLLAIGELLIDFTVENAEERLFSANPGGAPANFAAAAAASGAKTAIAAKVGADAFGDMLISAVRNAGVRTEGIVSDPSVFTTLAFVTLDAAGERSFSFARKPGADTCLRFEEIRPCLLDETRAVHFGSLSFTDEPARSAVLRAVQTAKAAGKLISYDPNYRPALWESEARAKEAMQTGLSLADVVKLSEEEAVFLTGKSDPVNASAILLQTYGCKLIVVTLGAKGCFFRTASVCGFVPAFTCVHTVDTTGAGDIFGGTLLAGLLSASELPDLSDGPQLSDLCRRANVAAGLSTCARGGIASVPRRETVERYL